MASLIRHSCTVSLSFITSLSLPLTFALPDRIIAHKPLLHILYFSGNLGIKGGCPLSFTIWILHSSCTACSWSLWHLNLGPWTRWSLRYSVQSIYEFISKNKRYRFFLKFIGQMLLIPGNYHLPLTSKGWSLRVSVFSWIASLECPRWWFLDLIFPKWQAPSYLEIIWEKKQPKGSR